MTDLRDDSKSGPATALPDTSWLALGTLTLVPTGLLLMGITFWRDWVQKRENLVAAEAEVDLMEVERGAFMPVRVLEQQAAFRDLTILEGEAAMEAIEGDEMVLGVVIEGAARAFPLNVMTGPQREVYNDRLGGRSIAATW